MGEDGFPGTVELICGIWFILKFLGMKVNFMGQATGIIVCVTLVLVSSIHVSSLKDDRRTERAATVVTFSLMLAAISVAFVFAHLGATQSDTIKNILSLGVGIVAVITSLINLA